MKHHLRYFRTNLKINGPSRIVRVIDLLVQKLKNPFLRIDESDKKLNFLRCG